MIFNIFICAAYLWIVGIYVCLCIYFLRSKDWIPFGFTFPGLLLLIAFGTLLVGHP